MHPNSSTVENKRLSMKARRSKSLCCSPSDGVKNAKEKWNKSCKLLIKACYKIICGCSLNTEALIYKDLEESENILSKLRNRL